jgi:hypothetical protein
MTVVWKPCVLPFCSAKLLLFAISQRKWAVWATGHFIVYKTQVLYQSRRMTPPECEPCVNHLDWLHGNIYEVDSVKHDPTKKQTGAAGPTNPPSVMLFWLVFLHSHEDKGTTYSLLVFFCLRTFLRWNTVFPFFMLCLLLAVLPSCTLLSSWWMCAADACLDIPWESHGHRQPSVWMFGWLSGEHHEEAVTFTVPARILHVCILTSDTHSDIQSFKI